ncbi:hypothetical protein GCM10016272_02560 [Psychrobacter glaciei]|uniref:N-acetylmuramidase domain-containing protein n=1 Tax=Psychrobacter glaciei TaxID=619771 RepID=A0ABQ3GNE5_9GAMM|nr:N-acetylmuramidase family protein [Psychrobacter glaciei]GHD26066.1 hypothetical protein GCM10016272_02560 [Psychrobacter glaciei]
MSTTQPMTLIDCDYKVAARRLRCDEASIRAVRDVESRGAGFLYDTDDKIWRIKILFERHIMYRLLKNKHSREYALNHVRTTPDVVNTRSGGYSGGNAEHDRLKKARKIDSDLGLESASWGTFQIMGFHWKRLGYKSAVDYVLTLSKGEPEQLEAFCRFIETDHRLLNAIRTNDWALFAEVYNGRDYKKNQYDTKMRDRKKYWDKELTK